MAKEAQRTAFTTRDIRQVEIVGPYKTTDDLPSLDIPLKVHNNIETLYARKKGGLTLRQYHAAIEYRDAYENMFKGLGGTMDFDRVRGPQSAVGGGPNPVAAAANKVDRAHEILRQRFANEAPNIIGVVERFAGRGYSIEECAIAIYGNAISGRMKVKLGVVLRAGLDALSDRWHGKEIKRTEPRAIGPKPTEIVPAADAKPSQTLHFHNGKMETAEEIRAGLEERKKKRKKKVA